MIMFTRFEENPAMTLQDIKETKRYGRTHARTDTRTHGRTDNVKTLYPPQTKFAGGIMILGKQSDLDPNCMLWLLLCEYVNAGG